MSTEKKEITKSGSPDDLIRLAISSNTDLEKLEKLMILKERYEANEAKKAYVQAMANFKKNPPKVTKDKKNSQYKSMYTSLGNLVNTVNPELSKQGLSASWDIKQNGTIMVTCLMTHELGHSESASASAPADISGAKNAIQQIKSTITYLKAVTFEAITGLASTDANFDDDGNAVGVTPINDKQLSNIVDMIASTETDEAKFLEFFKIEKIEELPADKYTQAMTLLKAKAGKKK